MASKRKRKEDSSEPLSRSELQTVVNGLSSVLKSISHRETVALKQPCEQADSDQSDFEEPPTKRYRIVYKIR